MLKSDKPVPSTDSELLKRYFGKEHAMSGDDKFLRDYILFKGWKKEMPN
eukprot:CAMPEP_0114018910 /NCGR_PEP_ID=MMETSP0372-20130328/16077_1 /TAXON_ID=340204 /ORGANISM="Lankesteria abbotti" /LENGTH=48 /assembly_acc=CAM_ASM_000359